MTQYKALFVEEGHNGKMTKAIVERSISDLPDGELLIRVKYSSLNFKDAMSAHGNKGVTRHFPHQPGIDAAGIVENSESDAFNIGDEVIVTGYDLGMNTAGGLAEYIRVPAAWALPRPSGLTLEQAMQFGTAGLTAQLCINKLVQMDLAPGQGQVLVTGATGGVGSIALALLAHDGFEVVASSGKAEQSDFLKSLGAAEVIDRHELSEHNKRPLLKERFAGAVDVVGGETLVNVIKSLRSGASVSCCGLVQSPMLEATVLPFILRGVNLLGVDSVEIPLSAKKNAWEQLAKNAALPALTHLNQEISLEQVPDALDELHNGKSSRHTFVKL